MCPCSVRICWRNYGWQRTEVFSFTFTAHLPKPRLAPCPGRRLTDLFDSRQLPTTISYRRLRWMIATNSVYNCTLPLVAWDGWRSVLNNYNCGKQFVIMTTAAARSVSGAVVPFLPFWHRLHISWQSWSRLR